MVGIVLHQAMLHEAMRGGAPAPGAYYSRKQAEWSATNAAGGGRGKALVFELPEFLPEEVPQEEEAPPPVVNPVESPAIQERMVEEQVLRMETYALEAGAEDPFAMTPEEIGEFRKRGDPVVW